LYEKNSKNLWQSKNKSFGKGYKPINMPQPHRFQDENLLLSHLYQEVGVVFSSLVKKQ
jgi:hypothetical protein